MQYVLHITKQCNFRCDYCPQEKGGEEMARSIALSVADSAFSSAQMKGERGACLSFYGGEPLLNKDLIRAVVRHCEEAYEPRGFAFRYRMTTNGAFLDEEFLRFAAKHKFKIALSIDGMKCAHDLHRRDAQGDPTFDGVFDAGQRLLSVLPDASAMMTVNPDTAPMLLASVRFLYDNGFRQIVTTPNYLADWTEESMGVLGAQYNALGDWYGDLLLRGDKLKLPLFDAKFVGNLVPEVDRDKCVPGKHRLSIAVDGGIYPCIQYVNHPAYRLGEAASGIDGEKLTGARREASEEISSCARCALNSRCDNRCGCKNLETTGAVLQVSSVVCAHERALIPIADALGERIFM